MFRKYGYEYNDNNDTYIDQKEISSFMTSVFSWMFLGLIITSLTAFIVLSNEAVYAFALRSFMLLIIAEIIMVVGLSWKIKDIKSSTAALMFSAYSALNGLTFAPILYYYRPDSVVLVFGITTTIFAVMSVYGYVTKEDLSQFASLLRSGIIILIIVSAINLFVRSPFMYWVVSYLGVLVFVGLIGYDVNRIKSMAIQSVGQNAELLKKFAIIGALTLYLDFINLFIYLLRIFGKGRD